MATETPEQLRARLFGDLTPDVPVEKPSAPQQNQMSPEPNSDEDLRRQIQDDVSHYSDLMGLSHVNAENNQGFWTNIAPRVVENAPMAMAGNLGGKMLRTAIPEKYQYNPELENVRETQIPEANKLLGQMHSQAEAEIEQRRMARENHLYEAQQLENEARAKQAQLRNTERQLESARERHMASNALEPQHFMDLPIPESTEEAPTHAPLTQKPIGGSGTAAYAEKFGATPEEASRVPSMSMMQKENIPSQASAMQKINALQPNVMLTEESPLLLTPEGQKFVQERKLAQLQKQHNVKVDEDIYKAQHANAVKRVAQEKFEAEQKVKHLEKLREQHEREAREALKGHKEHLQKTPEENLFTESQRKAVDKYYEIQKLKDSLKNQYGNVFSRIGSKVAPRFVPQVGAAFAPIEAEAAYEDWKKNNIGRALVHGAGALGALSQATNVPTLMGIGDVLQTPAALMSAYDIAKGKE